MKIEPIYFCRKEWGEQEKGEEEKEEKEEDGKKGEKEEDNVDNVTVYILCIAVGSLTGGLWNGTFLIQFGNSFWSDSILRLVLG